MASTKTRSPTCKSRMNTSAFCLLSALPASSSCCVVCTVVSPEKQRTSSTASKYPSYHGPSTGVTVGVGAPRISTIRPSLMMLLPCWAIRRMWCSSPYKSVPVFCVDVWDNHDPRSCVWRIEIEIEIRSIQGGELRTNSKVHRILSDKSIIG